jgi:hypothetical protein
MIEISQPPPEILKLPQTLLDISKKYLAIQQAEKKAFLEDKNNYHPVLEWYCGYVREKFLPQGEEKAKLKDVLLAIYNPENLPQNPEWFEHMQEIIGPFELTQTELAELTAIVGRIREDFVAQTSTIVKASGSDYITSHVLVGFSYAVQGAVMMTTPVSNS